MADRIARGRLRGSSLKIYDSRWKGFAEWCAGRQLNPWEASVADVADFLLYLFEEKGLSPRTVEGYRTAIASSLSKKLGSSLGSDPYLSSLIQSFFVDWLVESNLTPAWDLSLVLLALTKSPFEEKDMNQVPLKWLTYKTVFLLALASGARRSELHALDFHEIAWSEDRSSVTLKPHLGFLAKNHVVTDPSTAFTGFTVKAMAPTLDKSEPDRTLCPVRVLRWYLDRTKQTRKGRRALFLPLKATESGRIGANTVSAWLKATVHKAYEVAASSEEIMQVQRVRAHDIRAFSASWSLLRNISLPSIMRACRWKSHSTFTSFYLRDLTEIQGGLMTLRHTPSASFGVGK